MMNRTMRLFVSSTFSDFKAERDVLQREVFPKLQQLCLSKGLRFQAFDLRWGVSEEAGKDNRTMRICLRELRRWQESSIRPNFLVLLGEPADDVLTGLACGACECYFLHTDN